MKPYYYTFEWKDRVITLCLNYPDGDDNLYLGYSVKLPQDKDNDELAKTIALGRSVKESTRFWIGELITNWGILFNHDKGVLKAIARNCERNIKDGKIVIKGIR